MSGDIRAILDPKADITVIVEQGAPGPKGDKGDPGEPGEIGPAGQVPQAFVFHQMTPQAVWTIQHNLATYPGVTVVDSSGAVVVGDVEYVDSNNITITFGSAFGGIAYLN